MRVYGDSPLERRRKRANDAQKARHQSMKHDPEYIAARRVKLSKYQAVTRVFCASYKTDVGCVDCGYNAHPAALDFDHRDGSEKKGNVSRMVSLDRVKAEIAKCDVRCANCHRIKTYERQIAGGQTAHVHKKT